MNCLDSAPMKEFRILWILSLLMSPVARKELVKALVSGSPFRKETLVCESPLAWK